MTEESSVKEPRKKFCYVGAPEIFTLELACKQLNAAFDGQCYLVGSTLERADWRDVDVRFMMDDEAFYQLFPTVPSTQSGLWEFDKRWLLMTIALSEHLSKRTGLPIDFQFQPRTYTNKMHHGARQALGLTVTDA